MPQLDWERFSKLPGAATSNWELLCRGAVHRSYQQFGEFVALSQQPGVEFHLKVKRPCELGEPGRWWGWQCRWYGLSTGRQIGNNRRKKIEESINTTKKHLPELTDWVLCLKHPLTPTDSRWFDSLRKTAGMTLHLWSASDIENYLIGDAAALRSAYFGELVLTPKILEDLHDLATAPVRHRWDPLLHVSPHAENTLRRILGEGGAWKSLTRLAIRLRRRARYLVESSGTLDGELQDIVRRVIDASRLTHNALNGTASAFNSFKINDAWRNLHAVISRGATGHELVRITRALRRQKSPGALYLPALATEQCYAASVLESVAAFANCSMIAVIGKAGAGKTFLGAQLTDATSAGRPPGILLLGRFLGSGQNLDALLRGLVGAPFSTFDQMLEGLNAAAERAGCRLPVVIDGLNEAENPRDWKDLLAALKVRLKRYPNLLVVTTLRRSIAKDALPDDVRTISLPGFKYVVNDAIGKYFEHYKIDRGDAALPLSRFQDPLFLKLFCEATNPDKKDYVGVEAIPASLTAVFERYKSVATERVARQLRRSELDISIALDKVALEMWQRNVRSIPFTDLRELVGDPPQEWDRSIARALEDEGILYRDPHPDKRWQQSGIQYDAFAGFLIAGAILSDKGNPQFTRWIKAKSTLTRLVPHEATSKRKDNTHTLSDDIVGSLVGLLPQRFHRQLWPLLEQPLRDKALLESTRLEARYLDDATVAELAARMRDDPHKFGARVFNRVFELRKSPRHPLSSRFLDQVLRPIAVDIRDSHWSKWLYANRDAIISHIEVQVEDWSSRRERNENDECAALWLAWCLTSNVPLLRDLATQGLVIFGGYAQAALTRLVIEFLTINDPFVSERMLGAAYGLLMTVASTDLNPAACKQLLDEICDRYFSGSAAHPTNHWLTREYIEGIIEYLTVCASQFISDDHCKSIEAGQAFAKHPPRPADTDEGRESDLLLEFEFGLDRHDIESLAPYDDDEYDSKVQEGMKWIRYRVTSLSAHNEFLKSLDQTIDHYKHRPRHDQSATAITYLNKYAQIAYFELAGHLEQVGDRPKDPFSSNRQSDVDIDPSFPQPSPDLPMELPKWTAKGSEPHEEWMGAADIAIPDALLRSDEFGGRKGPWVAVGGYISDNDRAEKRKVFAFIRGFLVHKDKVDELVDRLKAVDYPGNSFLPSIPDEYYVFAGEIPWSNHFASGIYEENGPQPYDGMCGWHDDSGIEVEVLAHYYSWEDGRSEVNRAGNSLVPSAAFSRSLGLRRVPPAFDHVCADGKYASLTFSTPSDHGKSSVLYLREDLLLDYAAKKERELVWIVWGERLALDLIHSHSESLRKVYDSHAHIWRHIVTLRGVRG